MKNLTILLLSILFTSAVQSQSITKQEITGTWQVVKVVEAGTEPNQAEEMVAAYFDIHPDHNFQLRLKRNDRPSKGYDEIFRNSTWSYDESTQTIKFQDDRFPIKASKVDDKIIFELLGTGMKLEVIKPM